MNTTITESTRILVDGEPTTWGALFRDNMEFFEPSTFDKIMRDLEATGSSRLDDGAAGVVEIKLVAP